MPKLLPLTLTLLLLSACGTRNDPATTPMPTAPPTAPFQVTALIHHGMFEPDSIMKFQIFSAASLAQQERNAQWNDLCSREVLNTGTNTDANAPVRQQDCQARQAQEVKTFSSITAERTLADGSGQVIVAAEDIAEGESFQVTVDAQPQGTCFSVRKTQRFQRVGDLMPLVGFDVRQGWDPISAVGQTGPASTACLHGHVRNGQGQPLAQAVVMASALTPEGLPTLAVTDAQGYYRMAAPVEVASAPVPIRLEVGKRGYQMQRFQAAAELNPGWLPNLNRHNAALATATATAALIELQNADRFDRDAPVTLTLSTLPPSALAADLNAEQRLQQRQVLHTQTLTPRDLQFNLTVPSTGLTVGDYFEVTLVGNEPNDGCARITYTYRGLAQARNALDVSQWVGSGGGPSCPKG